MPKRGSGGVRGSREAPRGILFVAAAPVGAPKIGPGGSREPPEARKSGPERPPETKKWRNSREIREVGRRPAKKCRKKRPGRVPGSEKSARGESRGAIFVDFRSISGGFSRFVEVFRVDSRVFCRTCRRRENTAWAESKLMSARGSMPRISRISTKIREIPRKLGKLAGDRRKSPGKSAPGAKKGRKKRPR